MFDSLKQAYLPKTNFPSRKIDYSKCKKCRRCFDACPTYGFELGEDKFPVPIGYGGFEQACINCWNCVAVCPHDAISIEGPYSVPKGRYKTLLQNQVRFPDPLSSGDKIQYKNFKSKLTEVERIIYERRSNRIFTKKKVPEKLLKRILESGRFAPSAGNCQPYKFIVLTDENIISELEHLSMKSLRISKNLYLDKKGNRRIWKNILFTLSSWFMVNKLDPRPFAAMEKADRTDDKIYWNAPAVIIICKDKRGISNPDLDVGICAQNMALAAHSLGLGTCYIGLAVEPLSFPMMAKFRKSLGIKSPWVATTSLAIGYPKDMIDGVIKRDSPPVEWI